jgi:hypothetical protein
MNKKGRITLWLLMLTFVDGLINSVRMSTENNFGPDKFFKSIKQSITAEREKALASSSLPLSKDVSELPASFEDAVARAADRVIAGIRYGNSKLRIDFDTSIGDQTYTSLKNALPMTRLLVTKLSALLKLKPLAFGAEADEDLRTMCVFFPDMGAAALARRDWKMG